MASSNPNIKVRVVLACGCARNYPAKYQDERPVLGAEEKCDLHGDTEVSHYYVVGQ